ncbi:MAG: outer membrane lipoprotein chaperone LolA [Betaproteobacteria bacterium]|nr:outer membrane lipoprotein chaperone LolA [Betaproteobacteria bacterium]
MGRTALALLALLVAVSAQASSLERFERYLRTTHSARADFEQQVFDARQALIQTATGHFAFERPGRFRWVYVTPMRQLIVGDGARVWIYDEDLAQVTVRRLASALGSTPAALISGSTDVMQAFVFSELGLRDSLEWLEAKPRDAESGFDRIRLGMSAVGVEAMELVDHFGQTTRLRFSNVERNPVLDPGRFRFTPPPGTDVLGEP